MFHLLREHTSLLIKAYFMSTSCPTFWRPVLPWVYGPAMEGAVCASEAPEGKFMMCDIVLFELNKWATSCERREMCGSHFWVIWSKLNMSISCQPITERSSSSTELRFKEPSLLVFYSAVCICDTIRHKTRTDKSGALLVRFPAHICLLRCLSVLQQLLPQSWRFAGLQCVVRDDQHRKRHRYQ